MTTLRFIKIKGSLLAKIMLFICMSVCSISADAINLDEIAAKGKFPKFCIDVYRWGDKFFNTYDTAYVEGTGYKFNVKSRTETWTDRYFFRLHDNYEMSLRSDLNTSTGIHLSYLAISVGYDINVSKLFGNHQKARDHFTFGFNCARFSAELNWITNTVSSRIKKFGQRGDLQNYNIPFDGINTSMFSLTAYYYLNNKKYSVASAFNFSRIQKKSQGSFFFGLNYWTQDFNFDFSTLPPFMIQQLPESWADFGYKYHAYNHNYDLVAGYAYNWVFSKNWILGVSESPNIGLKSGYINYFNQKKHTFSLFNRARLSVIWNHNHWFAGGILKLDNSIVYDSDHSILNTVFNGELSFGYRFNLW